MSGNCKRQRAHRWAGLTLGLSGAIVASSPACAAPEEIQVYMDEMSRPGAFGLDIHNSYVATGDTTPSYAGEQQSVHRYRMTPEFSLGLSDTLELGAYLPLTTIDESGAFRADGIKLRLKYIARRRTGQAWFWGANFEIGRVSHRLDENPYNAELKGIVGRREGPWTVAFNANLDFKISGPVSAPASLELASKVSYDLTPKFALGIESYNGVGTLERLGRFGPSEQSSFVTVDTSLGRWDLNLGVGTGYGANADHLIFKAVVSVPIDGL